MNVDCGGQIGALQTRGTCWFYTILNGFILSEDGQAILFNRLKEFYKKLTKDEKAYFDAANSAPCPLKDLTKVKQIYFWKFIDQYLCLMGGPRSINLKAGRSAELLKNMNLVGEKARQNQGGKGASTQEEICKILDHIGFKGQYDKRFANIQARFDGRKKPQFVVVRESAPKPRDHMYEFPSAFGNDEKYQLMCCGIAIYNEEAKSTELHRAHAISGFVCNGKGFLFDSNQMKTWPCRWWIRSEMIRVIDDDVAPFYSFFRHGQITYYGYMFAIFARKEFTKDIRPACRLRYKNTKTPNVKFNFGNPNFGRVLNASNMGFNPAQIAALKRKWARTEHRKPEYLTANNVKWMVIMSKNRMQAYKKLATQLKAGLKIKPGNSEIFSEKVNAKFPQYINKELFDQVLADANNYDDGKQAMNDLLKAKFIIKSKNNYNEFFRKLREKFHMPASPPKVRSPTLNKINNIIAKAGTRLQALDKVTLNKSINVVKHKNYYSQKLREKFGSRSNPKIASPPKPKIPSPPKPQLVLNIASYNSIVNSAKNFENGDKTLRGLLNAGYKIGDPKNYNNFLQKLRNKFAAPKPFTFAEAKAHLAKFKGVTARKRAYANVWRGLTMNQRRVLMHYRNKGVWPTA